MVSAALGGTTSSALARVSIGAARAAGVPADRYVNLLGLAARHLDDDLCRIPAATTNRVAEETTVRIHWTELSVLLTRRSELGSFGVWDYLVTCAATPLEGIRDASAHLAVVADDATDSLDVTEDGDRVVVSHVNHADLAHEAACAVRGYALGLYQRRLSEAARRPLVPVRVTLAAKAPRRHHALTELYGTRAIEFEAPTTSITFRAADVEAATPHAQPGLSAVLRRHAEQTLATAVPLRDWPALFRSALARAYGDGNPPGLPAVARELAMSPRTLQRRLDDHGTTWTEEVDSVRRAAATRLLRDTDLSVAAVAARSGYADARALRRAVHRWYGTTPAALRRTGPGSPTG
ncbi:helix-turn-helix domain-containing protein [Streptomyces sp. NPDC088757]|uniref:helix-turn-helix domain-containing protein n=1 Tax=Streptomyces sp. NPDC088757 TaxID=3365889 RepID=UPI0038303CB6